MQLSVSEMVRRVTRLLSKASGYSECNDQLVFSDKVGRALRSLTPPTEAGQQVQHCRKKGENAAPNVLLPLTEPVADDSE